MKVSNISTPASLTRVMVPVWSAVNGQDDLVWYEAAKSGNAWYISVDSMNHKFNTGIYHIHVYATDSRGITNIVSGTTTTVKQTVEEVLGTKVNSTQTQVTIALKNVRASDAKTIMFAVWGEKNGQNDLKWYTANHVGNGNYTLTMNISNHKEAGTYHVHAYKKNAAGTMKISAATQFSISNIGGAIVEIVEKNEAYGTYKVKVSNISSPAAITQVLIPTWSAVNGQDDIKWYTAVKSGNAWYATIEAYNHGYDTGTYISHAYVTDARGIQAVVGAASTNVNATIKRPYIASDFHKTRPKKIVAITFDDGPGAYTERLLNELKVRGAKVTFFVLGSKAERYPGLIRRMASEGHEIGNHSYNHATLTKMSAQEVAADMKRASTAIYNASGGVPVTLMRPHYNKTVQNVCKENNWSIVLWSLDTRDWESRNETAILNKTFNNGQYSVKDGSIILLHDIYGTSVNASLKMIDRLIAEGYTLVMVSELLYWDANGATAGGVYR